jgi:uncharacterized protein YdhG (YjbR/CyaY superfamily)
MKTKQKNSGSQAVQAYIAAHPSAIQLRLQKLRSAITKAAPGAHEDISYGMPAYNLNGYLVYFAAFKNHIGLYATPSGHEKFKKALSKYKVGKGSVQFPHAEELPIRLIQQIVKFRVAENLKKRSLKESDNEKKAAKKPAKG